MHVQSALRVRTSLVVAGAAGTILAALLLGNQRPPTQRPEDVGDDGMRVTARLVSSKILTGPMDHDLAITITAPEATRRARPAVSLAVVIDRSGSMHGEPLQHAKTAAAHLIAQLDGGDAFSIVTYSSGDETVVPMTRATEGNKRAAVAAIESIYEDGGTCISCGITRGAGELEHTPIDRGLARMVVISDGQANEGIFDRDELADLAANTAARGVSISTVGVGLDFDEVTMVRLANVGRGNYYFAEDAARLDAMFARELGGLAETVATNVKLVLADQPGTRIEEAYGYPMMRSGSHVIVPIADLRAGETRKVVLRVSVAPPTTGDMTVTHVELGWQRVAGGEARRATTTADVEVVDDAAEVARSIDPATVEIIEQALSARAIEEASAVYETHGADAAQQVLELRAAKIRANHYLPRKAAEALELDNDTALDNLRTVPAAKARKVNSVRAYELAR